MRKNTTLSGIALAALLLGSASVQVQAASLTIGGDGAIGVDIGSGGGDSDASLSGDVDANADNNDLQNLFGTGGDNLATVDASENSDAFVTLFGTGGGGEANANLDAGITLFGGSDSGGPDNGGGAGGGPSLGVAPDARIRVAATRTSCFTPDQAQIAHLLGRTTYSGSVTASWQDATRINIVPVNLCPAARTKIAAALDADANIGVLHAAVAGNARIKASLRPNYNPDDVLAVDETGNRLTVYVY